jgi:hypothetical protein
MRLEPRVKPTSLGSLAAQVIMYISSSTKPVPAESLQDVFSNQPVELLIRSVERLLKRRRLIFDGVNLWETTPWFYQAPV